MRTHLEKGSCNQAYRGAVLPASLPLVEHEAYGALRMLLRGLVRLIFCDRHHEILLAILTEESRGPTAAKRRNTPHRYEIVANTRLAFKARTRKLSISARDGQHFGRMMLSRATFERKRSTDLRARRAAQHRLPSRTAERLRATQC